MSFQAIDFFCGCGGMSYGFQQAGIPIVSGIDNEPSHQGTYEANIEAPFLSADISALAPAPLQATFPRLQVNDNNLIMLGCPPCQFFSRSNKSKNPKSAKGKNLLCDFLRFVHYFNPGYVVMENVPGFLKTEVFTTFVSYLIKSGYGVHYGIHNTQKYGVPQSRKRLLLIADRVRGRVIKPLPVSGVVTLREVLGKPNGFPSLSAGHKDTTPFLHSVQALSPLNLRRAQKVRKDGGDRLDFQADKELQIQRFIKNNKYFFPQNYSRLFWDKPAPTITTKFTSFSTGRHLPPAENRTLSLREGATLQSFPKDYIFHGSFTAIARQIGNAVPPLFAKKIAQAIKGKNYTDYHLLLT